MFASFRNIKKNRMKIVWPEKNFKLIIKKSIIYSAKIVPFTSLI